jgi:PGM1 C-terminal domain
MHLGGSVMDNRAISRGLGDALLANSHGSTTDHVLIAMPSFGLGDVTLEHYASRIGALEHRYLFCALIAARIPGCEIIYLCSRHPGPEAIEYLISLAPEERRALIRDRFHIVVVPDSSPRSLAQKLIEHPDIMASIRRRIGGRTAFIEPWNVTEHEVGVAEALGVPINGTSPELWPLGFKGSCRRIFRAAGVPLPYGHEDVASLDDVRRAIMDIQAARPDAPGVVVKHDNSVSGDGNAVIRFSKGPVDDQLALLPDWYVETLADGGIVEELIAGDAFTSPSAQLDILPGGEVRLLATHEQILGGPDNQVYQGCMFPADPAYAGHLAASAVAIGKVLAQKGVIGRFSTDFAAVRNRGEWRAFALEVNLRKGGTTHPFAALRNLVPGHYDASVGHWLTPDGRQRAYCATDNMVDPAWLGLPPGDCIAAVRDAGLQFDPRTGVGIVLHMLSCLEIDGRFGLTAIAETTDRSRGMRDAAAAAVDAAARSRRPAV